ncbi:43950_t:CDS:1, partial [Gigaspora margarita]
DLNTVLNYLDHHIYYDRPTTFAALRTRFGLLTNNLVNDGVDALLNVLFPNTTRRSRSSTPSLPENFSFEDFEDWSYSPPSSAEARDNYENELLKDGLNLPRAYFENGNFPCVPRRAHDVPVSFTKSGRTMTSVQLCDYYKSNNVIVILFKP